MIMLGYIVLLPMLGVCIADKEVHQHVPHPPIQEPHYFEDGAHNMEYDHEAILGSKGLDEEYAQLEPEEARKRLGVLVDKMDTDSDGFVTRDELTEWVLTSFRSLDEEEALEQLEEHDVDADGAVSWEEYLDKVYGYVPEEVVDFEKDDNAQVKALGEMINLDNAKFKAADVNSNGVLDKEEYPPFMHPYDFPHMHDAEIDRILQTYDKNNNGAIELKEYIKTEDFPHDYNKEQEIADTENFDAFDYDANGKLERDEIKSWALPDQREAAEDEADHLIEETDRNRDSTLSKEEILDQHELWVGSSATDYGRHIHDHEEL